MVSNNLFRKKVKVTRHLPGTRINGHWMEGRAICLDILASVQAPTPNQLMAMDEGRRTMDNQVLFTDTELRIADPNGQYNSDCVQLGKDKYEVSQKFDWQNDVINHYKYVVTKIAESPVQ